MAYQPRDLLLQKRSKHRNQFEVLSVLLYHNNTVTIALLVIALLPIVTAETPYGLH